MMINGSKITQATSASSEIITSQNQEKEQSNTVQSSAKKISRFSLANKSKIYAEIEPRSLSEIISFEEPPTSRAQSAPGQSKTKVKQENEPLSKEVRIKPQTAPAGQTLAKRDDMGLYTKHDEAGLDRTSARRNSRVKQKPSTEELIERERVSQKNRVKNARELRLYGRTSIPDVQSSRSSKISNITGPIISAVGGLIGRLSHTSFVHPTQKII